jgi:hypothetical protein
MAKRSAFSSASEIEAWIEPPEPSKREFRRTPKTEKQDDLIFVIFEEV